MLNTIFAIVLGAVALFALAASFRGAGRSRIGWLIVFAAAVAQAWNLLNTYSVVVAVVATAALVLGYVMARAPAGAPPA